MQTMVNLDDPLAPAIGVAIQIPRDAEYGGKVYEGSGWQAADALRQAFDRFSQGVSIVDCPDDQCDRGGGYFVALTILHWEDRATGWSGRRDRVTLRVTVYDTRLNHRLTSSILQSQGSNGAASGHVQTLLTSLAEKYVSSLY